MTGPVMCVGCRDRPALTLSPALHPLCVECTRTASTAADDYARELVLSAERNRDRDNARIARARRITAEGERVPGDRTRGRNGGRARWQGAA